MRKLYLIVTAISAVVVLTGCPKKKTDDADGGDAASDATVVAVVEDAAPPPPPAPVAKNANEVARFGQETAVTDDDAKIAAFAYARTAPKGGTNVAPVKPGLDVTKIAEYQEAILCTFADPKDATGATILMGWVDKSAFTAFVKKDAGPLKDAAAPVVDAGSTTVTCPAGQTPVVLGASPVCKKKCTKDTDCKVGTCAPASGPGGKVARVCAQE